MNILGIKIAGHDTGAALIADGRIVAVAEERLNRVKHSPSMFPRLSIPYCLKYLGLSEAQVDLVVIDQIELPSRIRMEEIFLRETRGAFSRATVHVINHHDAHAASAFFCSPFQEAAVLVYDGTGEKFATHLGVFATETDTLYRGHGTELHQIHKNLHRRERRFFPYTFGIGKLYSFLTDYVNLGQLNEGKLMGLAPYGDDSLLRAHPPEAWCREMNGHVVCNSRITYPGYRPRTGLRYRLGRPLLTFIERVCMPDGHCEPDAFPEIRLPRPRRTDEPLPDTYYASAAYAAQKVFERAAMLLALRLRGVTGSQNLCVAGGCGLNIDANLNFLREAGFENLFVQPGSSDAGVPLGLALWGLHVIAGEPRRWTMQSAALGRPYTDAEIVAALAEQAGKIEHTTPADIAQETAQLIAGGSIIGWFSGGGEYGPRALGHRSILCDARRPDMRDVLNLRVKHREAWRPFAASVLRERVSDFFDFSGDSPFMLIAAQVKKDKQGSVPSVTHVDGTCRIQTVTAEDNGPYYRLIKHFYEQTGTPLILNTSFNLGGEPIVETPQDALRTFLATNMDYLVLEKYLVRKAPRAA